MCLGAYAHQELPFEKLVEEVRPERVMGVTPLFQVMMVLQNAPVGGLELPGLDISYLVVGNESSKFDLTLFIEEEQHELIGSLEYDADLFEPSTIERMVRRFEMILRAMTAQPDARLSALEKVLAEADRRQRMTDERKLEESSIQKLKQIRRRPVNA